MIRSYSQHPSSSLLGTHAEGEKRASGFSSTLPNFLVVPSCLTSRPFATNSDSPLFSRVRSKTSVVAESRMNALDSVWKIYTPCSALSEASLFTESYDVAFRQDQGNRTDKSPRTEGNYSVGKIWFMMTSHRAGRPYTHERTAACGKYAKVNMKPKTAPESSRAGGRAFTNGPQQAL